METVVEEEDEGERLRRPSKSDLQREACLGWVFDVFEHENTNLVSTCARVLGTYFLPQGRNHDQIKLVVDDVCRNMTTAWVDDVVPEYHNFFHGADVMLITCHFALRCGGKKMLTEVEAFALAVAALGHDVCHPGLNNAYHVAEGMELAIRYSDVAVLEAHSAAVMSRIIRERKLLDSIMTTESDRRRFRAVLVNSILATDMAGHFKFMERLKQLSSREDFIAYKQQFKGHHPKQFRTNSLLEQPEDRLFMCDLMLHCADLSNPTRPWAISKQWSDRVQEEFFRQGDSERSAGRAISPNMDRNTTPGFKLALGFADFIVKPLYTAAADILQLDHALSSLQDNRRKWLQIKAEEEAKEEELMLDQQDEEKDETPSKKKSKDYTSSFSDYDDVIKKQQKLRRRSAKNSQEQKDDVLEDSCARRRRRLLVDASHRLGGADESHHQNGDDQSNVNGENDEDNIQHDDTSRDRSSTLVRIASMVWDDAAKATLPFRTRVRAGLRIVWKSQQWSAMIIFLVVVSLLLDSARRAFMPKAADPSVNGTLVGMLGIFVLEMMIGLVVEPKYVWSFVFFANVMGTGSLAVDVPYLLGRFFDRGASASVRAARVARLVRFVRLGRASFLVHFVDKIWPPKKLVDSDSEDGWAQSETIVVQGAGLLVPPKAPMHRSSVIVERQLKKRQSVADFSKNPGGAQPIFLLNDEEAYNKNNAAGGVVVMPPSSSSLSLSKTNKEQKNAINTKYESSREERIGKRLSLLTSRIMMLGIIVALCAMPFADPTSVQSRFDAQRQLLRALGELSHEQRLVYIEEYRPGRDRYGLHALYLRIGGFAYVPRKSRKIKRRRRQEKHGLKVSYDGPQVTAADVDDIDHLIDTSDTSTRLITDVRRYERDLAMREFLIMLSMIIVVNLATLSFAMVGDRLVVQPLREMVELVEKVERLLLVLQRDAQQSAFETDFIESSIAKIAQMLAIGFATSVGLQRAEGPNALSSRLTGEGSHVESKRVQAAFVFVNTHDLAVTRLTELSSDKTVRYLQLVHHIVTFNADFFGGKQHRKTSGGTFLLVFMDDDDEDEEDGRLDLADAPGDAIGVATHHRTTSRVQNSASGRRLAPPRTNTSESQASSIPTKRTRRLKMKVSRRMLYSALRMSKRWSSRQVASPNDDTILGNVSSRGLGGLKVYDDLAAARPDWKGPHVDTMLSCDSCCDAALQTVLACALDANFLNRVAQQIDVLDLATQLRALGVDDDDQQVLDSNGEMTTSSRLSGDISCQQQPAEGSTDTTVYPTESIGTIARVAVAARRLRGLGRNAHRSSLTAINENDDIELGNTPRGQPRTSDLMAKLLRQHGSSLVFTAGLHFGWAVRNSSPGPDGTEHESYMSPHVNLAAKLEVAASSVYGVPILFSGAFGNRLQHSTRTASRRLDRAILPETGESPTPIPLYTYDFLPTSNLDQSHWWHKLKPCLDHSELATVFDFAQPALALQYADTFDRAVVAYLEGRWSDAQVLMEKCVTSLPADRPARSILAYMARSQFVCPIDWRGYRKI